MALVKCILGVVVLLLVSGWSTSADAGDGLNTEKVSVSEKQTQTQEVDQDLDLDLDLDQDPDVVEDEGDIDVSSEGDAVSAEEEGSGSAEEEEESGSAEEEEESGSAEEEEDEEEDSLSVSERLELANKNLEGDEDSVIEDGDVAVHKSHVQKRNADRCVTRGCKWPRSRNKKVYVPYVIARHYSSSQLNRIKQAFRSFHTSTCIRFVPRYRQRNYLYIFSHSGCWSYIGRRGRKQYLSLRRNGCVYMGTIQHELLHALGFQHEHKRSDRDRYIRVLWGNIIRNRIHNFRKTATLNLGTPYDYNSVMHYSRMAFSKNRKPTLVARRPNVTFGRARRMSSCDIARVNRLYCR